MINLIVIAGCAGGVGGCIFGIVVERMRNAILSHRAELHAERVRATALSREVADLSPAPAPYTNGAHHAAASLDA